jgi:hypothetical protein
MEITMRKIILTGAALTLMCGSALAQSSTGPAPQGDNVNKPGMSNGSMHKGATHNRTTGTTIGQGRDPNGGNPNGTAGGPTSLSGTGSSKYGGNGTAGTTNGR